MKKLLRSKIIQAALYYSIKALILLGAIFALLSQNWERAFLILIILIFSFLPSVIAKKYRIYLPVEIDFVLVFFIFITLFLGEMQNFYHKFWWWDLYIHVDAGFWIGILGFVVVYIFNKRRGIHLKLSSFFVALFAFTFAITFGVFWEIFEYMMDSFFALNMQKSGLVDTMWDLIVTVIGASTVSVMGYFWLKNEYQSYIFDISVSKFVKNNPKIFKK